METLSFLMHGFGVALTAENLWYCFVGAALGTVIGVLPGLGPLATVSMLLPLTFALPPAAALIMLAGIYYGAQYGGSTTSILVNLPGESSSVVTCIDGHQLARQGRAGPALSIAAFASLFGGLAATVAMVVAAAPLVGLAQLFGPAEYVSLMVLGLIAAIVLSSGHVLKALAMVILGLLLGTVGTDLSSMAPRMTLGYLELTEGIGFVPLAVGLFALPEIMRNLENSAAVTVVSQRIGRILPTAKDIHRSVGPTIRGSAVGTLLGILPGGGAILSSFAAYSIEKRVSKTPGAFGNGAIEGVAAPEAANNAGAQTSFIPLLTLGLPSNPMMAMMAGAMMIHGIQPGPNVISSRPDIFWGLIASMFVGNIMLILINLPLIRLWVSMLRVPYRLLYPLVLVLCCIGVYGINNSAFDVMIAVIFGIFGYMMSKLSFEPAPLVLAFVLSPLLEENLQRAMLISGGNPMVLIHRPVSLTLLAISGALLLLLLLPTLRSYRTKIFTEED